MHNNDELEPSGLRYERVIAAVRAQPWAIRPEKMAVIVDLLRFRAAGGRLSADDITARIGAARPESRPQAGGIAVIPVFGVITQRASMMSEMSGGGGASTEKIGAAFAQAMADPGVGAIVLQIDSPGGGVYGVDELATQILKARGPKPIVAIADSMAASAAYWIASAAGELVITPSGEVGSIGVFAAHEDTSRFVDALGVTVSLISAGKYKLEGNPFEPLGEEARAALQSRVDDYYSAFTAAVAKGRGASVSAVRSGFGEGRMVGARDAVRLGMADSVGTFAEVLDRLSRRQRRSSDGRAEIINQELLAEHEASAELLEDFELLAASDMVIEPELINLEAEATTSDIDLLWRRLRLRLHSR